MRLEVLLLPFEHLIQQVTALLDEDDHQIAERLRRARLKKRLPPLIGEGGFGIIFAMQNSVAECNVEAFRRMTEEGFGP